MKKPILRLLSLVLMLVLVLSMVPVRARSNSMDTTVSIKSVEDFMAIMDNPDGSYRLDADLDLGEILPLGFDPQTNHITRFTGSLDGNGHTLWYSLSSHPEYDNCDLGLFAWVNEADIFNLSVRAQLYMFSSGYAGLIAGQSVETAFRGLNITGTIRVEEPAQEALQAEIAVICANNINYMNTETPTAAVGCQVDVDFQSDLGDDDELIYYGILPDTRTRDPEDYAVYTSAIKGEVRITGGTCMVDLLNDGYGCTVSQNVVISDPFDADVNGLRNCVYSDLSGTFTAALRPENEKVKLHGLDTCTDCQFLGRMTATGSGSSNYYVYEFRAAYRGQGCTVECPMDIAVSNSTLLVEGLKECTASSFTGNLTLSGLDVDGSLLSASNQCSAYGDTTVNAPFCYVWPLNCSNNCYGTGDVTVHSSGYPAVGGVRGTGSCYVGNIRLFGSTGGGIYGVDGDGSFMQGELTAVSEEESSGITCAYNGGFFSGTARADSIIGAGPGSFVSATLYAEHCTLAQTGGFLYGTVYTKDVGTNITGYVDARVVATECNTFTVAPGGYFGGSADIYPDPNDMGFSNVVTVSVTEGTNVTIHHPQVGTLNAQTLGNQNVYYHSKDDCNGFLCTQRQIIYAEDIQNTDANWAHYDCAIQVGDNNMGDPDVMDDAWEDVYDPETDRYTPEREPMSYTLQAVDANGKGVGGVWFHLGDQIYHADENGCLELQWGPGVISPLVITDHDSEGADTILRQIKSFFPIPDRVNKIQVSEALNIDFLMNGPDTAKGDFGRMGGFTFDVLGHQVEVFDLPLEVDLEFGETIKTKVTYNSETGLYDVVVGTVLHKDSLPTQEDVLEALMKEEFPRSYMSKPANKVRMMGAEWSYEVLGTFSIEWDGTGTDFVVHESKVMLKLEAEARYSSQLPPPVTMLYATAALSGSVEAEGTVDTSPDTLADYATAQLFATVKPTIRLEGAIGVGSRYVDVYAEVGAGGELEGEFPLDIKSLKDDLTVTGTVDVFGEIRALIFSQKFTKELVNVQLWPRKKTAAPIALGSAAEMELLPRDYVPQYALQSADVQPCLSVPNGAPGTYPYMDLQLCELPNQRYLLVWTDDDLSRGDADRSVLRAAIYDVRTDVQSWGDIITVDNDGTADLFFDVCVDGEQAALVWQDLNRTFGDGADADLENVSAAVELNTVILDCTGETPVAGEITTLSTGKGVYESLPTIHYRNRSLRLAWFTSTVNDPTYIGAEEYTLWLCNGKSTAEVTTTDAPIEGIAFTETELLWSEKTAGGGDLWRRDSNGKLTQERTGGVRNLQSRGQYYCWTENGSVFRGSGPFSWMKQYMTGLAPDTVVRLGSDDTIYMETHTGDNSAICTLSSDGTVKPILLEEGYISSWSADGVFVAALVKTGPGENENARLVFSDNNFPEKLIISDLTCDEPIAAPGSTIALSMTVTNLGDFLSQLNVSVADTDGTILHSQYLYEDLDYGESTDLELLLNIPADYAGEDLTVTVNEAQETLNLGGRNLAVEANWSEASGDVVQICVRNTGTEADRGAVSLYEGEKLLWSGSAEAAPGAAVWFQVQLEDPYDSPVTLRAVLRETPGAVWDWDNEDTVYIEPILARKLVLFPLILAAGEQRHLELQTWPSGAVLPGLRCQSSDPAVASVDGTGTVTARAPGEATITVTTDQGESYTVTVTVTGEAAEPENPFTDVPAGSFYEEPVLWAIENGITNGTAADTFSPDAPCNRAAVVTFLWRAAGCPDPKSTTHPFVDVEKGSFYEKAVLWAVENNITNGVDATHFGPTASCNRAQVVTFLYRAQNNPSFTNTDCPFTDVEAGLWYEAPILWAVEKGVTNGMGDGTFGVNTICNRAQVVTFLHRTYTGA